MLIGGAFRETKARIDIINPATGNAIAKAPRATAADLDDAVTAATNALAGWVAIGWDGRRQILSAMADAILAHSEELSRLVTLEQGKTLPESMAEVAGMEYFFRQTALLDLPDRELESSERRTVTIRHRPLGVVAAIVPWNFPLMILAFKLPPALLAGNTVVVKPAPTTPLATLRFAQIVQPLLPPGVLNVLVDANDLGQLLTGHKGISKISFTGSTATGRRVMESAASTIKRITLELGGNDPAILLDDVDLDKIAPRIFANAFLNAGQVCVAIKRVYVPDRLHDRLRDALVELANTSVVGNGLEQGVTMGPLQNAAQRDKVYDMVNDARHSGAHVHGGGAAGGPGYFLRPAIVSNAKDEMTLVAEEQFGPALPLVRYSSETSLSANLNRSPFGLGASIWSDDPIRAADFAEQVESGSIWINGHMDLDPMIPFCGTRQSGLGCAFGLSGLAEYTSTSILNVQHQQ